MENQEFVIPTDKVNLISKGLLYKNIPPTLTYKNLVTEDENILYSSELVDSGTVFNQLVKRKIQEPILVEDLLIGDYNQILVALRVSGYGEEYVINVLDPDTNEFVKETIDLTKLKSKELSQTFDENGEFSLFLPISKKNIKFVIPTVGLGDMINNEANKRKGRFNGTPPFITTKLEFLITSIDGNRDKSYIHNFVNALPPRDRLAFMKELESVEPELLLEGEFISRIKKETYNAKFNLGIDFFYPAD